MEVLEPNTERLYRLIGRNIYKFRVLTQLSQARLAEKANISAAYISQIECARLHKGITCTSIIKIAESKKFIRRFAKYRYFWFQISIDGSTAELYDEFRGVEGSFNRSVNGALEISDAGIPLVIAHTVTPKNLAQLEDMINLSYQLGANSIILGEVMPSGRAYEHAEVILSDEQKNFLYGQIEELSKKFSGKIVIQRSAELKIQMERYVSEVNAGGIIRPNGDFRIDCMAPFTIGNVLKETVKNIWLTKGIDAWRSDLVKNFVAAIDEDRQASNYKNHVEADVAL